MGQFGSGAKFVEAAPNEKRKASKKARGFGMGYVNAHGGDVIAWCQSNDPLFKVKGKERTRRRLNI